jgi:hypothetical protein
MPIFSRRFIPPEYVVGQITGPVGEAGHLQHLAAAVLRLTGGHAVQAGEEHQVLAGRKVRVNGEVLRHVADGALGPDGMGRHRLTGHHDLAAVALKQPGDHRDRRGLAGPVRAQQSVRLTRVDVEPDPVNGDKVTKAPPKPAAFQHPLARHPHLLPDRDPNHAMLHTVRLPGTESEALTGWDLRRILGGVPSPDQAARAIPRVDLVAASSGVRQP